MDTILLTGGAGYIGSHVARELMEHDYRVIVLDNLSTGKPYLIPAGTPFYYGDFTDVSLLDKIFTDHTISSVIHCAARIDPAESLKKADEYFEENYVKTIALVEYCVAHAVGRFLFSSTAAVYGNVSHGLVSEQTPCQPLTPYGASKLKAEGRIADFARAGNTAFGILRYFNVAGADPKLRIGQPNSHSFSAVSNLCRVILGQQDSFVVYGNDYDTPDGSCVRDFIHVSDIATLHRQVLDHLNAPGEALLMNCGYGHGFSVFDLLKAAENLIGRPVPHVIGARRDGDIPYIIADTSKLKSTLRWAPKHDHIDTIIFTALEWERKKLALSDAA